MIIETAYKTVNKVSAAVLIDMLTALEKGADDHVILRPNEEDNHFMQTLYEKDAGFLVEYREEDVHYRVKSLSLHKTIELFVKYFNEDRTWNSCARWIDVTEEIDGPSRRSHSSVRAQPTHVLTSERTSQAPTRISVGIWVAAAIVVLIVFGITSWSSISIIGGILIALIAAIAVPWILSKIAPKLGDGLLFVIAAIVFGIVLTTVTYDSPGASEVRARQRRERAREDLKAATDKMNRAIKDNRVEDALHWNKVAQEAQERVNR